MIVATARKVMSLSIWLSWRALTQAWLLALIVAVLALTLINLPYAPAPWFDEGSHLHVPKTLILHGVYADISSEGYRYYGPTVGVGPTVMLPIALVFKLFGIGLLQARLVIVAYMLIAFVAFYKFGRRLHNPLVALLALTLLLASRTLNYPGFIEYSRQVLGEIPGVAYLFLGALAWLAALRADLSRTAQSEIQNSSLHSPRSRAITAWMLSILAGLGFGLALVTKNQFALIVPPALALIALLDWRYYQSGTWRWRLVPLVVTCACFGLWTLAQFQFLGPGSFWENIRQTRQAASGAIFVFNRNATLRAGYYLLRPDLYGGLLIPSLGYTIWKARRRDAQGLAEAFVALLIGLWLAWFVGASLGWPRYAFPAVALGALTVARMLVDMLLYLRRRLRSWHYLFHTSSAYIVLMIALPLTLSVSVVDHPSDAAQRFAAYLNANIPSNTVIETWEPELGLLTDHRYHYPPIALLDTAVQHQWLGKPAPIYDGLDTAPPYVVIGSFGSYSGVYRSDILARDYIEQQQIGSYVLFKHK